jgi:hypothetical protein
VNCGSILCNNNSINNAANETGGALYIANNSTTSSGRLHLGTNAARTGEINIGGSNVATSSNPLKLNATSTGLVTIGAASGSCTIAAPTSCTSLLTANAGVSSTSLAASTTLGVTGLSTLANVNASGLISANAGLSSTSLLSPLLDSNAVPLVIGQGLSSETKIGIATKKLTIFGAATSQIDLLGGGIKCGTLAANFIDTTSGGTLTIGGTNCTGVTFSDSISACTFTGSITKGAPTIMSAGSALPSATNQVGYCGLTKNGTTGFVSYNFTSGPLAASRNYWVYGTTQLVVGGTYFVTMYLNFTAATTFVRALLVNGATNVADGVVAQGTWSTIGALNMAGSGIVSYPTGLAAGAEVINSTYYQCTSANSYIGLSVCVCNGTVPTANGNYSIG